MNTTAKYVNYDNNSNNSKLLITTITSLLNIFHNTLFLTFTFTFPYQSLHSTSFPFVSFIPISFYSLNSFTLSLVFCFTFYFYSTLLFLLFLYSPHFLVLFYLNLNFSYFSQCPCYLSPSAFLHAIFILLFFLHTISYTLFHFPFSYSLSSLKIHLGTIFLTIHCHQTSFLHYPIITNHFTITTFHNFPLCTSASIFYFNIYFHESS